MVDSVKNMGFAIPPMASEGSNFEDQFKQSLKKAAAGEMNNAEREQLEKMVLTGQIAYALATGENFGDPKVLAKSVEYITGQNLNSHARGNEIDKSNIANAFVDFITGKK